LFFKAETIGVVIEIPVFVKYRTPGVELEYYTPLVSKIKMALTLTLTLTQVKLNRAGTVRLKIPGTLPSKLAFTGAGTAGKVKPGKIKAG
jgi:hypothetical protein